MSVPFQDPSAHADGTDPSSIIEVTRTYLEMRDPSELSGAKLNPTAQLSYFVLSTLKSAKTIIGLTVCPGPMTTFALTSRSPKSACG
jgi:hypothetical protein